MYILYIDGEKASKKMLELIGIFREIRILPCRISAAATGRYLPQVNGIFWGLQCDANNIMYKYINVSIFITVDSQELESLEE